MSATLDWMRASRTPLPRGATPLKDTLQRVRTAPDPKWLEKLEQAEAPAAAPSPVGAAAAAPVPVHAQPEPDPIHFPNTRDLEVIRTQVREETRAAEHATIARYALAIDRLDAAAQSLQASRAKAGDAVELALAIAREVIGRELSVDGAAIASRIDAALESIAPGESVRVRVSPEDLQHAGAITREKGSIELIEDPTLPRGSCVVESDRRVIDASIDSRMNAIKAALSSVVGARDAD